MTAISDVKQRPGGTMGLGVRQSLDPRAQDYQIFSQIVAPGVNGLAGSVPTGALTLDPVSAETVPFPGLLMVSVERTFSRNLGV